MTHKFTLSPKEHALLMRIELHNAQRLFAAACATSRHHMAMFNIFVSTYGDGDGVQISSCMRAHFPLYAKEILRALATQVNKLNATARTMRPPQVRTATINALARAIVKRDGTGFYGVQS